VSVKTKTTRTPWQHNCCIVKGKSKHFNSK